MHPPFDITSFLRAALTEDIGDGDVTSIATIPAEKQTTFVMRARQDLVGCGVKFLPELFALIDPTVCVEILAEEGALVIPSPLRGGLGRGAILNAENSATPPPPNLPPQGGEGLARISGSARALLAGERVALNLIQQLSGVATLTRAYVDAITGTGAKIYDTRKTIPNMRHLQKYAVRCGGGENHRMGLYDAVLIKDNHIAVVGSVKAAVEAARQAAPAGMCVEVECDTLAQVNEALAARTDMILLDNMSNDMLREAVARITAHNAAQGANILSEASGNVSLTTVRAIAGTGVNRISVGKLTHSAIAVDIGLDEG